MRRLTRDNGRWLPALALAVVALVNVAQAYLDPGTGSYIWQLLIGVLFGGVFAAGVFWRRTLTFLKRLFSGRKKPDGPGN
jgi:Na+/proline symporter